MGVNALGSALVALSALGFATNPILGKFAYAAGANSITLGAIRFTLATAGLWLVVGGRRGRGLTWRQRGQLVALGALGMGLVALLYFTALEQQIGASLATGLFYTYPAMVTGLGLVRGEGLSRGGLAGLLLTMGGTWLLLGADLGAFTWQGAVLILAAAALYSAYTLVSEVWTRGVEPLVASAHGTLGAAVVFLALALGTGQPVPQPAAFLAAAGLSLCSTILAVTTYLAGLAKVGSTRASIISTLEPVFTALLAVMFLGERLTGLQTVGIGLVMVGAVAAQTKQA